METLKGSIERVTYYNAENGYSVVKIMPDGIIRKAVAAAGSRDERRRFFRSAGAQVIGREVRLTLALT